MASPKEKWQPAVVADKMGPPHGGYTPTSATLTEALDLKRAVHVGHSTGGGEVARYIGRHGTKRVAKPVLIGAITLLMLKTPANPNGTPIEAFDKMRAAVRADRSRFWKELRRPFYGYNRPGVKSSDGVRESFWGIAHGRYRQRCPGWGKGAGLGSNSPWGSSSTGGGMTKGRHVAAGASTPAWRTVCCLGVGTATARRHRSDRGSMSTATVPSRNGRLRAMRTRPSGMKVTCSAATGGRRMYLSRARASRAPARVAAWSPKPAS